MSTRSQPTLQNNTDHKMATVQGVVASRKVGRVFIFSISAIVVMGFLLAGIAFSLFIQQQKLTNLTQKHEEVWREIRNNLIYVMGRSEDKPISIDTAKSVQQAMASLLAKEISLHAKIDKIIADTEIQRYLLKTTQEEESVIINSQVDPKVRKKIDQFITASPALVRIGFSFWDAATIVKIHSGRSLQPLASRSSTTFS
ncbi:MAG: hypothetical protein L3J59_10305 [Methylococcaceae bacterium]|nr:hypothetical protein [Methylococcaceae bacterium]